MLKRPGLIIALLALAFLLPVTLHAETIKDFYDDLRFLETLQGKSPRGGAVHDGGAGLSSSGYVVRGKIPPLPLRVAKSGDDESAGSEPIAGGGDEDPYGEELPPQVPDPLEPINRAIFQFNDKLYFWVLKPAARGYRAVVPQKARVGVRNFFYNLAFPIRFVNCLLQGKIESAADEIARFVTNTPVGVLGLIDVASQKLELEKHDEDLGQTFGAYGMGPSFYIVWPIFGPSSLRDSLGSVGDAFLDPLNYAVPRTKYRVSVGAYKTLNETSLSIGKYEDLKRSAIDPYTALRDVYFQRRRSMIKE